MANQTVTTVVNYDDLTISALANGDTLTINGGSVTINADVRWNQQAAVLGPVTLSSTLGGSFFIDGTQVWEVPFSASTGVVPAQGALGTNTVTSGSGATGELTRVWATGSLDPAPAGSAMPPTGFIKLRSKNGNFQNGDVIFIGGGSIVVASGAGKRSWIHVAARELSLCTVPRLGTFSITGDWYELGTTNGLDDQVIQFPVADECPALQVETTPGSGVYEWWLNAGRRWVGQVQPQTQTVQNMTDTANIATRPAYNDPAGFLHTFRQLKETATNSVHTTVSSIPASGTEAGIYQLRTVLKKDTRRWGFAQIASGVSSADRYGVIIDFDAAGAVVSTPTVGSPLNTSHTVTSLGGGAYLVELTINVVSNSTSTLVGTVGASNSATPTLVNGQPSYLGVVTEGIWYTELQLVAPSSIQYVNSTDERARFFFSNPQSGTIIFAQRTGRTAGLKPASGCKIRIPNVILSNAPVIDYTINTVQIPGGSTAGRYGFSTASAGVLSISHATMNWYAAISSAFSVNTQNTAMTAWNSTAAASAQTYNNIGVGMSRDNTSAGFFSISNTQTGGTISNMRICRDQINSAGLTLSASANFTLDNVRVESFGNNQGRIGRIAAAGVGFTLVNCSDITLNNPVTVGTGYTITTCSRIKINNPKYACPMIGATSAADADTAIAISTSAQDILVDNFSTIPGLTNVHPSTAIVTASVNCTGIDVRNIGTPTALFNGGSAAQMSNAVRFTGTVFDSSVRRVYTENLSSVAIAHAATNQRIRLVNLWGDAADAMNNVVGLDVLAQGCRWSNPGTAQNAVYGFHWEDAFTSTTSGRLSIFANEPLPETADQCVATFGANAGFTSAGGAYMPNVGDQIIWTMPYFALGHTGVAQFGYGASAAETWVLTATNGQVFEFEYQIDKGSGFSAWKPFLNIGRRGAGGASGTNTITVTAADWDALTTKPVVGDYLVMGTGTRLPANTTITNIAGYVLTLSNNFASAATSNELMFFYKDIRNETISPATGYKLKVKCRANTASTSNVFNYLRIPFDTNATDQQIQYPLPTTQNTGTVSNIQVGSRIQVYNETTDTEIANEIVAATPWVYPYDEGTDFTTGDLIRVRLAYQSGTTAKVGFEGFAVASASGWSLLASQVTDSVYAAIAVNGSTVTEFAPDYPNIEVDIDDPDGTTSINRLYAWFSHICTTEDGIRYWLGGIVAEDNANFKIITSLIDLRLDNVAATGVQFVGEIRLYRDDGAAPVVAVTTGGGSITLYAGKVYVVTTGGSALTPAESAKLMGLPDSAANATAVLTAAQAAPIHADARKMNGAVIEGTGQPADQWRGAS